MTRFYRTRVLVDILSEDNPVGDGLSLAQIGYEIDEGGCVGTLEVAITEELTGLEVARRLTAMGSEPGFFRLDAEGNELS